MSKICYGLMIRTFAAYSIRHSGESMTMSTDKSSQVKSLWRLNLNDSHSNVSSECSGKSSSDLSIGYSASPFWRQICFDGGSKVFFQRYWRVCINGQRLTSTQPLHYLINNSTRRSSFLPTCLSVTLSSPYSHTCRWTYTRYNNSKINDARRAVITR